MSRYTGSEFKRSRSLGFSTTETGRELTRRPNRPGQHGADRRGKPLGLKDVNHHLTFCQQ